MFINDEKIGDLAVEVVGQIHVAVKRDYCFFFNFKSILHKKHIILCSTEYLLHKKLHFFSISLFSHEQKSEHNFLLLLSDNRYRNRRLAVEVVGEFHVAVK